MLFGTGKKAAFKNACFFCFSTMLLKHQCLLPVEAFSFNQLCAKVNISFKISAFGNV